VVASVLRPFASADDTDMPNVTTTRPQDSVGIRPLATRPGADGPTFRPEGWFAKAFEASRQPSAFVDPLLRFSVVNDAMALLLDRPRAELEGRPVGDVLHPNDLDAFLQIESTLRTRSEDNASTELRAARPDGSFVWTRWRGVRVDGDDEALLALYVQIENVSDRRALQDELGAATDRYRKLIEDSPSITYAIEVEGNLGPRPLTPAIAEMLGVVASSPVDDLAERWVEAIDPEDRPEVIAAWDRVVRGVDDRFACEYRIARGQHQTWLCDVVTVQRWHGRIHVEGVLQDIDERKRMERDLVEHAENVAEADARLGELDQLRAEFVATASHELRTPLTNVIGYAVTLQDHWEGLPDVERRGFVRTIEEQGRLLLVLVEELLMIGRIESRGLLPTLEPVELGPVLGAVAHALSGAELPEVSIAPGVVALADRGWVERIADLLLANAARHGAAPVRVSATPVLGAVELAVEDAGPGVPPDLEAHVFDRFVRAADPHDRLQQGFGLGLALVRELAEAMGGAVRHERVQPRGARFVVTLPTGATKDRVG
jgi:PAS domain S-box-containing protein